MNYELEMASNHELAMAPVGAHLCVRPTVRAATGCTHKGKGQARARGQAPLLAPFVPFCFAPLIAPTGNSAIAIANETNP